MDTGEPNKSKFKIILDKILEKLKLYFNKLQGFYGDHKLETNFFLSFIVYLILLYFLFINNPFELLNSSNRGFYIFGTFFGGFLLMIFYFFFKKKKEMIDSKEISDTSFLMKIIGTIVFFGALLAVIGLIMYLYSSDSFTSNFIIYILNAGIFIALASLVVKYFKLKLPDYTSSKPTWYSLIKTCILYTPCLLISFSDWVKKEYEIAPRSSIIIIVVLLTLILLRFLIPKLIYLIVVGSGDQLLKEPINTNMEKSLGKFKDLNYKKISNDTESLNYKYAISSWIYFDSFPPSTNRNYEKFTPMLNIANKPNISVNIKKNTLKITMRVQSNKGKSNYKDVVVYKTKDIKYQRWNNFVVNYDGKILDIFLNNELVASVPGIIAYSNYDQISSGKNNGVLGGICNVIYFNDYLSRNSIHMLYYASKNLNPPII